MPTPDAAGVPGWLVLTGIPANQTGTGRFVRHILREVRGSGRRDVRLLCSPVGARASRDAIDAAVAAEGLLLLHPQFLGFQATIEIVERRAAAGRKSDLYLLDCSFFCVKSYNTLPGVPRPCLRCLGTDGDPARGQDCTPDPIVEEAAFAYVAAFRRLVAAGHLRLHAQNALQGALARHHAGADADVTVDGLWCDDWNDSLIEPGADAVVAPPVDPAAVDVVFHGFASAAKGATWIWMLAQACPELTFFLPISPSATPKPVPPNVLLADLRWETGLRALVRGARLTMAPSLWSAPIEGSVVKSLLEAPAVAVVENDSAFAAELPDEIVLRLPVDIPQAAERLRAALKEDWRPDDDLRRMWVASFEARNRRVVSRLLPPLPGSASAARDGEVAIEMDVSEAARSAEAARRNGKAKPRFLQVANFYAGFLEDLYASRPGLAAKSFAEQTEVLLDGGFSAAHLHVRNLADMGWDTMLAVPNSGPSQSAWLRESVAARPSVVSNAQVLAWQIETFRPDVLYTLDAVALDSRFLSQLSYKPPVVMAWRGYPVPPGTDWRAVDVLLSSFDRILKEAPGLGASSAVRFHPGFPAEALFHLDDRDPRWDVVFTGQVTQEHAQRMMGLGKLVDWARRVPDDPHRLGLFMPVLPPGLDWPNQGAVWGHDMLRRMRDGRVTVNIDVDSFGNQPPNMRLIEATGAGAFLLTPSHPELGRFFEPGREVETFDSYDEMIEKIDHYLAHPEEREAIALRGQERCLSQHALRDRSRWLAGLMMEKLAD